MISDAEVMLRVCGMGSYLHIGSHNYSLVFELLKRSVDAFGLDSSAEMVNECGRRAPGRFFHGSLRDYPFNADAFDTLVIGAKLFEFNMDDMVTVLQTLRQMTKRNVVIYLPLESKNAIPEHHKGRCRLFWEQAMVMAGFRKHRRSMLATPYHELEDEAINHMTFFEKVPELAASQFSIQWLLQNRDLHMDMLREAGRRSDGHVSRYVYAATKIRPGDTVLDAACGLGYGTAVMAAISPGAKFIGVDIDNDSIAYATANYAEDANIRYQACDVTKMAFLPDHSIDTIVSFETIEHVPDYDIFLKEARRVLKPDGRFIGSVPNLWCDETGNDPNPYHFHVFDWDKLNAAVSKYFIVDERLTQIAGGGYKLHQGKRSMETLALGQSADVETEWWIISACGNPLDAQQLPYENPFYEHSSLLLPPHVCFEKYYDNPWLYRVMVQLGERLTDKNVLADFCKKVLREARAGSADQGAALCVLSYQLLESGNASLEEVAALSAQINDYDAVYDRENLHAWRWAISLHYVGGRLLLAIGQREGALAAFLLCAVMDPMKFSPLLATKTISARMYAGLLYASSGLVDDAKMQFTMGVKEAHKVLQGNWENILGSLEQPLGFGLPEAAEILDIASQCASALRALDKLQLSPGYFWDKINLRRFGLVEWNKSLERENDYLRRRISELASQKETEEV